MAGYTDYLNLYFKNPRTDGADTFNIQTMMNDNWNKIDAFASMAGLPPAGTGFAFIRCKDASGNPVSGCVVQINDLVSVSSASGLAKFQIAAGTYSALVRAPIDYGLGEQTVSITVYDGKVTEGDATISNTISNATMLSITTSCFCAFSNRVSNADAFAVGAGASGGAAIVQIKGTTNPSAAASGGGSGYTSTKSQINLTGLYEISIGAGGDSVSVSRSGGTAGTTIKNGNEGGETTVKCGSDTIISAKGGAPGNANATTTFKGGVAGSDGGSGSGAASGDTGSSMISVGASGIDGNDGGNTNVSSGKNYTGGKGQGFTTCPFGESNNTDNYSQAGGSAYAIAETGGKSVGSCGPGAGRGSAIGSSVSKNVSTTANDGITPGSGGGAAVAAVYSASLPSSTVTSGKGADGLVIFRWEVAS